MSISKAQKRDELSGVIRDALRRAEEYCKRVRPWDSRLLVVSIICGAVATLLAGGTVAGGMPVIEPIGGWRVLCSIVAVFTASATASSALHKTLQVSARVSSAEKCIARLRALQATMAASDSSTDEVLQTFQRISEEHAVCLA